MVILGEDHCGCFLGAWLWAVGYSYPSVFSCFQLNWISAFSSQFLVSLSLQFKYLLSGPTCRIILLSGNNATEEKQCSGRTSN